MSKHTLVVMRSAFGAGLLCVTCLAQAGQLSSPSTTVPLWGRFESSVTNANRYANPFIDVALQSRFTKPDGTRLGFIGFHDGDGNGGQTGNAWKFRFMPDQVGRWSYEASFSDGTPGMTGQFECVVQNAKPGPLRVEHANPHSWKFADGTRFFARAYTAPELFVAGNTQHRNFWINHFFGGKYHFNFCNANLLNFVGVGDELNWQGTPYKAPDPVREGQYVTIKGNGLFPFLYSGTRPRFDGGSNVDWLRPSVACWANVDEVLAELEAHRTIWFNHWGMLGWDWSGNGRILVPAPARKAVLRYWIARLAPWWNVTWNIAGEWDELLTPAEFDDVGSFIKEADPWKHPLTSHALGTTLDRPWVDFRVQQFSAGTSCDAIANARRAVADYAHKPVFAFETSWEATPGKLTPDQVRTGAWGSLMGGAFYLYAECFEPTLTWGDGKAFKFVEIMEDFFAGRHYWDLFPSPALVNPGTLCLANPGQEYVLNRQNGGPIVLDLSKDQPAKMFTVEWFNPRTGVKTSAGKVESGAQRSFTCPDSNDWVLSFTSAASKNAYGKVELLRDTWGIPHIFSDTDRGGMYGLGYATAQERGFQMTYGLRIMQGRLAELIGFRSKAGRRETALDSDHRMRTFGWARAAARIAPNLDPATLGLLEAYCHGVNTSFAAQQKAGTLHPLFEKLEVSPEEWKPADCLLSWWHVAQYFAGDGTRDLMVWHNRTQPQPGQPQPPEPSTLWMDDASAVVQREDVPMQWLRDVEQFCSTHGLGGIAPAATNEAPKFSHAWVVGGTKTTTGSAVLVSDPQTPVRNPSLWMEFHVKGKTFDARGIGMPGSPGFLIGFTKRVAWGLTALGADQADLFRLETSTEHPDEYRWNGQWRKMQVRTEKILVKGADPITLTIRETHLGPVVSEFAFRQAGDPEVALKRVPVCETNRDTIQGVFAMIQAQDAKAFHRALADWQFPSANCVYGDAQGHIGFSVLGVIPVRSRTAPDRGGGEALAGSGDLDDWQGFVPAALLPQVQDPGRGLLLSANHRAIGSFYQVPLGTSTGSLGDTIRSWRLRERLSAKERFDPADVLDVHYDTVNPARREIVRLGLHLRQNQREALSDASLKALSPLEQWLAKGASSDLKSEHAALATRLSTFFRFVVTPLARKYGGGESGLARFLKDASSRIKQDPKTRFEADECSFVDRVLSEAWDAESAAGPGERQPPARGTRTVAQNVSLGWFDSLDGFGSLDPAKDVAQPGITCFDGQTIHCQSAQSYTQWVPLHDVDSAQTICPFGHSDRPDSRYRTSTMDLWAGAKLHAAPLSREAVERITVERETLCP